MLKYIGIDITEGERNRITMEQNDYIIREKLRTPIVVKEEDEC